MFTVLAIAIAAFASVPAVLAQGSLQGLLQALNSSGLDQLSNAAASLNSTPIGQSVLAQLSQGHKTIFAPTDLALFRANPSGVINQTALANLIAYHVVSGNFVNETQTYPNVTVGRTLLNDSSLVTLEGNRSQVLVWSKYNNGTLFVENQGNNNTILNTTNYNGTSILTIDTVLVPPPNMSVVLNNSTYNLGAFTALLQNTSLPNDTSAYDTVTSSHGVTVFAPNNAGIQAAAGSLASLSGNTTALQDVLANHVINGTSVYSTELSNRTTYVSAGGQDYSTFSNSSGFYVSVGGSNPVQIVEADILTSNGVVQIVNGVMLDTNTNPALASSAYASATSVAGHVSETGPVASPTSTSTSTSTPTPAGAVKDASNWMSVLLAGMLAVGFGQFA